MKTLDENTQWKLTKGFMSELLRGNIADCLVKAPDETVVTVRIDEIRLINSDPVKLQIRCKGITVYESEFPVLEKGDTLTLQTNDKFRIETDLEILI